MNAVGTFFSVLAYAWLAYAGYRLWGGTASNTTKWVGVGLVGLMAIGLTQDLLDLRRENVDIGVTDQTTVSVNQIVEVKGAKVCLSCTTLEQDGKYVLEGNWVAGELTLEPSGTQPYALNFERGTVKLDGQTLNQGCSTGELGSSTKLEIGGARQLRLEIGPGARCR